LREGGLSFSRGWLAVAIAAVVWGAAQTIPVRHLWDPDEARYAEVTREMLGSNQLLVPFLYGETYAHKPPLYFWSQASLRLMGANWTLAAVAPPLLAMLATLLLLPRFAESLGLGRATGNLAALILASTPFAAGMALTGRMDMVLTLLHTAALLLLARLLGVFGGPEAPRRAVHLGFWGLVGLSVLTKGPVALALPLLAAVTVRALARRSTSLRPLLAGGGPLLFLAIVLAWVVPAALAGGREYAVELLIRQTADRVVPGSFGHPEPFWFHVATYPLTGLPWSPLVIVAAVAALRRRDRSAPLYLAVGVVSLVVLFSIASGKLALYLLPMFPIAALLAADHLARGGAGARACLVIGSASLCGVGAAVASIPLWQPAPVPEPQLVALAGAALLVPSLAALVVVLSSREVTARPVRALAVAGLSFVAATLPLATRVMEPTMNLAGLAAAVVAAEPERSVGFIYQERFPGLCLYAERDFTVLESPTDLARVLRSGRWVVIEDRDLRKLPAEVRAMVGESRSFPHKRRALLLIRAAA
jgi:4-amino-4-deoxy-L-arabinose transferase-like glycosyltransferase